MGSHLPGGRMQDAGERLSVACGQLEKHRSGTCEEPQGCARSTHRAEPVLP